MSRAIFIISKIYPDAVRTNVLVEADGKNLKKDFSRAGKSGIIVLVRLLYIASVLCTGTGNALLASLYEIEKG